MGFVLQRHYFCSRTAEKDSKQPTAPANGSNALRPSAIVFVYNGNGLILIGKSPGWHSILKTACR